MLALSHHLSPRPSWHQRRLLLEPSDVSLPSVADCEVQPSRLDPPMICSLRVHGLFLARPQIIGRCGSNSSDSVGGCQLTSSGSTSGWGTSSLGSSMEGANDTIWEASNGSDHSPAASGNTSTGSGVPEEGGVSDDACGCPIGNGQRHPSCGGAYLDSCNLGPYSASDVGDGSCQEHLNTEACDYDGGETIPR